MFSKIKEIEYVLDIQGNAQQKVIMKEIVEYLNNGNYTSYSRKADFLALWRLPNDIIAEKLLMTEGGVRQVASRLTKDFYGKVGYDLFELLLENDEHKLQVLTFMLTVLNKGQRGVVEQYPLELVRAVDYSGKSMNTYPLSSCFPEMIVLYHLRKERIQEVVDKLDADKLCYLLSVLDNKQSTVETKDWVKLHQAMNSDKLDVLLRRESLYPPIESR